MLNGNKLLLAAMIVTLVSGTGVVLAQSVTTAPAETPTRLVEVPAAPTAEDGGPAPAGPVATQPAGGETDQQVPQGPVSLIDKLRQNSFFIIMIGGFILLYIWMGRGRRKKEAKRKEMLASLAKGDKVTSIGGIVGTIMEVREDEVTVKVDENNNIRMKFARWAVRGVGEEARTEKAEDSR